MIIGIIPARGGSKAIPNKNIININEKPLINWTILQMLNSSKIDSVYVTSDCDEILSVAQTSGAKTIKRPKSISGDEASSESAWLHALDVICEDGFEPEVLVLAQATSPVRSSKDFDKAIESFFVKKLDSLFSCNIFDDFNYWEKSEGEFTSINYDYTDRKRRQEIRKKYHENGSFYLTKPKILRTLNNRLGGKIGVHAMPNHTMFQIDEERDLDLISVLIRAYND